MNRNAEDLTADPSIVDGLLNMLDENNNIVKAFRMEKDNFSKSDYNSVQLRLIGRWNDDGKNYNRLRVSEITTLIVGDIGESDVQRDIIKQISELHPSFMAMQYPLLFPYGKDNFKLGILYINSIARSQIKKNSHNERVLHLSYPAKHIAKKRPSTFSQV